MAFPVTLGGRVAGPADKPEGRGMVRETKVIETSLSLEVTAVGRFQAENLPDDNTDDDRDKKHKRYLQGGSSVVRCREWVREGDSHHVTKLVDNQENFISQ